MAHLPSFKMDSDFEQEPRNGAALVAKPETPTARWSAIILALAALFALLTVFSSYYARVFDLHRKDYGEGTVLAMVERMHQEPVSPAWLESPRRTFSSYGPGYYWAVALTATLFEEPHSLIPGRSVNLAALAAAAVLMFFVVVRTTGSANIALMTVLLFATAKVVDRWTPYHRVDMLALPLALASYAVVGSSRRQLFLSAVLVVLGSLVRQTTALCAVGVVLHLWLDRRRGDALLYGLMVGCFGAAVWLGIDRQSGGFWLDAAIGNNLCQMDVRRGIDLVARFLSSVVGLSSVCVIAYLWRQRWQESQRSIWCVSFVASFLTALLLSCKSGSSWNYFLEPSLLGAVVVGKYGLPVLWKANAVLVRICCALTIIFLTLPHGLQLASHLRKAPTMPPEYETIHKFVGDYQNGSVLSDGDWIDAVIRAGRQPAVNDPFLLRLFDQEEGKAINRITERIQADLTTGRITLCIFSSPLSDQLRSNTSRWPNSILETVEQHFVPIMQTRSLSIYVHRNTRPEERNASEIRDSSRDRY